jgi:hypothetical protein
MTLITKTEPEKVIKKKVYLSKNKKLLLELINQEKKNVKKDGND